MGRQLRERLQQGPTATEVTSEKGSRRRGTGVDQARSLSRASGDLAVISVRRRKSVVSATPSLLQNGQVGVNSSLLQGSSAPLPQGGHVEAALPSRIGAPPTDRPPYARLFDVRPENARSHEASPHATGAAFGHVLANARLPDAEPPARPKSAPSYREHLGQVERRLQRAKAKADSVLTTGTANTNLGAAAVRGVDAAKAVRCPVCLNGTLPPGKLAQLLPTELDRRNCAHHSHRFLPPSDGGDPDHTFEQVHWHGEACSLCAEPLVRGPIAAAVSEANECYRRLERHGSRRPLSAAELAEAAGVVKAWARHAAPDDRARRRCRGSTRAGAAPSEGPRASGSDAPDAASDATVALASLNLAFACATGCHGACAVDLKRCRRLLEHAASEGDLPAAWYNLGLLDLGLVGLAAGRAEEHARRRGPSGCRQGVERLALAAEAGYAAAAHRLALLVRDGDADAWAATQDRARRREESGTSRAGAATGAATGRGDERAADDGTLSLNSSVHPPPRSGEAAARQASALASLLELVQLGHRDACADAGALLAAGAGFPGWASEMGLKRSADPWSRAFVVWARGASLGCAGCTFRMGR